MVTLVIASVGGTFTIVQSLDLDYESPTQSQGALLVGNVKVTQFDGAGNIIAYRQGDNHIVRQGMEVIMAQVFGGINTSANYPHAPTDLVHPVRFMQIGTDGERRLLHNDTMVSDDIANCVRQLAVITNNTAQGAHGYRTSSGSACTDAPGDECSAQMNVTATASFFGSQNCNVASIDEAGIFTNETSIAGGSSQNGGFMFARNTFGSVTLMALDTLQLDWEFTFTDS